MKRSKKKPTTSCVWIFPLSAGHEDAFWRHRMSQDKPVTGKEIRAAAATVAEHLTQEAAYVDALRKAGWLVRWHWQPDLDDPCIRAVPPKLMDDNAVKAVLKKLRIDPARVDVGESL